MNKAIAFLTIAGLAVSGLALSGLTDPVSAQVSSQGGPVMIGADSWVADENAHTQTWDGRVEIVQGDSRLRADHIVVTYAPGDGADGKGWGEVLMIEATGNIYYVTPEETVRGDKAVYTETDDTMLISGTVVLQQGQNVMTGSRLMSQVKAGTTVMDAAPGSVGRGRVKGVFYPDEDKGAR
jgi:lipopolysaccharide export system protein LptA